jgi:DNA-binding Xre family transcriptional regulator
MFQSNLKNIMVNKNVTLRGLVNLAGISKQTIVTARQDKGISQCRLATLAQIASALGVFTKDLYDETQDSPIESESPPVYPIFIGYY